jgi:hypothetical protein
MRRILAILFLFIYLFGSTGACQVLKFPLLVSHYIKHKREVPSMTVASFLKMHYVDPQPFDADYNQDMQLPFKTPVDFFTISSPVILPGLPVLALRSLAIPSIKHIILNDQIPSGCWLHDIFQPPRL